MAILLVGPAAPYSTVSAAVEASSAGDTVQVKAGTYLNDFPTIRHSLNLVALDGVVRLVATLSPPNGKAILDEGGLGMVVSITGFSFSGAKVESRNGAGIRYEGGRLTLNSDTFSGNEEGLLGGPDPAGVIVVNDSVFNANGSGDGYTHNIYVGAIQSFTFNHSASVNAVVGHEIKSRAAVNMVQNSLVLDGTASASYSIDFPNGGNCTVTRSVIQQGANSQNPAIFAIGEEGVHYLASSLTLNGNTIVDDLPRDSQDVRNPNHVPLRGSDNVVYGKASAGLYSAFSGTVHLGTRPALNLPPSTHANSPEIVQARH